MKFVIKYSISLFFFSLVLHSLSFAKTTGTITINAEKTEAKLMMFEVMNAGDLSGLYQKMQVPEVIEKNSKSKTFKLSNNLFIFSCQSLKTSSQPTTNCTMIIRKPSRDTNDFSVEIYNSNEKKFAVFKSNSKLSSELSSLFPVDTNDLIMYSLQLSNFITIDANGSTLGETTVGFYLN